MARNRIAERMIFYQIRIKVFQMKLKFIRNFVYGMGAKCHCTITILIKFQTQWKFHFALIVILSKVICIRLSTLYHNCAAVCLAWLDGEGITTEWTSIEFW